MKRPRLRRAGGFLAFVDDSERVVVRMLTVVTGIVIITSLIQLTFNVLGKLILAQETSWLGDDLIKVLGDLLTVLIALEVLENVTSYLRHNVIQMELVLATALTAVARKVIVLPSGSENKPQLLIGLGVATAALAASYWMIRRAGSHTSEEGQHMSDLSKSHHGFISPDDINTSKLPRSADSHHQD
ncbi:membrane protein [cyanobiont of Ornithocercus magnificus]|nr:membrane protein [cyanobiont of Ornithocercus magnificus]